MPRTARRISLVCLTAALCVAGAVAPSAGARQTYHPAKATHIRVATSTSSTMTVTTAKAAHASKYVLYVSTVRSDLYYANMTRNKHTSHRHTATASGPRITVRGLAYTTKTYWYRVRTINGSKSAYSSDILAGGVRPSTPTSLKATNVGGISLTWSAGSATGYLIKQATNSSFTTGVRYWRASGSTHQFTPYGIAAGKRYWFAVRSVNNGSSSGYSNHVSGVTSAHEQNLRFMTYNVLSNVHDGSKLAGHTIAPWSRRGPAVAATIKKYSPDVVAVQEAGNWVKGKAYKARQVDSLKNYLGSGYALAHTERTYPERKRNDSYCHDTDSYCRTYSYILYKKSTVRTVGNGGHFALDGGAASAQKFAAYQHLQSRSTGAHFLMVSAHLYPGNTHKLDLRREAETKNLVSKAKSVASHANLKIVYGGDFNSSVNTEYHNPDGPGLVMRSNHVVDSRLVAQKHYNAYSSVNNTLSTTPRPYPYNTIDYLWATAGISPYSWGVGIRTKHGKQYGTIPSDHHAVYSTMVIRH